MAAHLQVHPHFNAEEAAIAAAEFVQNLDNLPGEVNFLLSEIRDKDERISQLLGRINQRHYGLTKSVKNISSTTAPTQASFTLPIPAGETIPTDHLSTKDAQSVSKIQAEWGKIQQLQDDKVRLAERLERIVSRARERGKSEWRRVGGMDIDDASVAATEAKISDIASADFLLPTAGLGSGTSKRNKKGASAASSIGTLSAAQSPAGSMAPPPPPSGRGGSHARGGGSRGTSRAARDQSVSMSEVDVEPEAEMEVDIIDGTEVEADDQLYCFCQQKSFGEMVGCDNDKCKYEWFHIKCVNLTAPLPETWYCPECVKSLGFSSSDGKKDRKGRKK